MTPNAFLSFKRKLLEKNKALAGVPNIGKEKEKR